MIQSPPAPDPRVSTAWRSQGVTATTPAITTPARAIASSETISTAMTAPTGPHGDGGMPRGGPKSQFSMAHPVASVSRAVRNHPAWPQLN
jgi:hypothetical protein